LVGDRLRLDFRHPTALQPAQDAELGLRIAQAVEHHHAQQPFGIELAAVAQDPAEGVMKAEFLPQGGEQPGVADGTRGCEVHRAGALFQCGFTGGAQQAVDQGIRVARTDGFKPTEGGDDALAGNAGRIAEGFDELDVLAWAGGRDLDEHVATVERLLSTHKADAEITCHYRQKPAKSLIRCYERGFVRKFRKFGRKVSNSGCRSLKFHVVWEYENRERSS